MPSFRGSRVNRPASGANAGKGYNPHHSESDDAPAFGIPRPPDPHFYDWKLDPDMNPEHSANKPPFKTPDVGDSDIPTAVLKDYM